MKKAIIYIACFGLGLGIVWTIRNAMVKNRISDELNPGYSIARQVQYGFTIRNNTGRLIPLAEFWTYAPVKQTGFQQCTGFKSNYPYELISDGAGNQVLHFKFEKLAPYTTHLLTIRADLMLAETSFPIPDSRRPSDLKTEPYVESDHPAVARMARQLRGGDAIETVNNIAHWVSTHISYSGYSGQEHGAYYALKYQKGDCTEFADLFVALCRANNIPARRVGGYIYPQSAVVRPQDYHNWAEFYEDGRWKIADPQNKKLRQNQADYIAMEIIQGSQSNPMGPYHRFRFKGEGLKVKMN
jgi:hypothetical protein